MKVTIWKISRYWNRLIFRIIRICVHLIWDQTKGNSEFFNFDVNSIFDYHAMILTNRKKEYKKIER